MDPSIIDEYCHYMANTYNILVVSGNYRKAPRYRFPVQPCDAANLTLAIANDNSEELRCGDRSNIAICGFSSGANLALALGQVPAMKKADGTLIVKGSLGVYGNYDVRTDGWEKMANSGKDEHTFENTLKGEVGRIHYTYAPDPSDRENPLASPFLAPRADMPKKVYLIGCEKDILWPEAQTMCERLAKEDNADAPRVSYTDGCAVGWHQGGIQWELLMGKGHSWELQALQGDAEMQRKADFEAMCARIATWLKEEVFV